MRFGAVRYLNARPLIEGLEPLVLDTPAGLAARMEQGELDVALLPVAAGEQQGLRRVGRLGIAAYGRVDSVLIFVERNPVRTLKLDSASRTSRILARLLAPYIFGLDPEIVENDADAELVIGDAALDRKGEAIDLAYRWTTITGHPFVFAAWYGDPAAAPALAAAYERGREQLANYASGERLEYLRKKILYEIGPREEEGLALFLKLARSQSLL